MQCCKRCEKKLTRDDIALYKKIIDRYSESFLCTACIAKHFEVSTELMEEKIRQFKKMGCTLFKA